MSDKAYCIFWVTADNFSQLDEVITAAVVFSGLYQP